MPAEVLCYFLNHQDIGLKLTFQLVLQCAPLIKRKKVSCGVTVEDSLFGELSHIFMGTGIMYRKLADKGGRSFVLFYREGELKEYLHRVANRSFMQSFGYDYMELPEMLDRISTRVAMSVSHEITFPHEIGVFFGYPIEDVKGFIENGGKGYLLSGYWKVYSNPMVANKIFTEFERAKTCAVNGFLTGKSMGQIAREDV